MKTEEAAMDSSWSDLSGCGCLLPAVVVWLSAVSLLAVARATASSEEGKDGEKDAVDDDEDDDDTKDVDNDNEDEVCRCE
jgi:hypothetical protein